MMDVQLQTTSNPYNVYNVNYSDWDFTLWSASRVDLDPTSDDYTLYHPTGYDTRVGISTPMNTPTIFTYLEHQKRIKSGYSRKTVETYLNMLAIDRTGTRKRAYEPLLTELIWRMYSGLNVELERQALESIAELDPNRTPGEDLFSVLNRNRFFHVPLSYEFVDKYFDKLDPAYLRYYMPWTRMLIERHPSILQIQQPEQAIEYTWRIDRTSLTTLAAHARMYPNKLSRDHYSILDVFAPVEHPVAHVHFYRLYELDTITIRKYAHQLDTELLFEQRRDLSAVTILELFDPAQHNHAHLLHQITLISSMFNSHSLDWTAMLETINMYTPSYYDVHARCMHTAAFVSLINRVHVAMQPHYRAFPRHRIAYGGPDHISLFQLFRVSLYEMNESMQHMPLDVVSRLQDVLIDYILYFAQAGH
jgi:hypothetical protein